MPSILVVDDDKEIADLLIHFLQNEGYEAQSVYSSHDALAVLERKQSSILVTDIRMPDMNGIELISEVNRRWPETIPAIVITAYSDIDAATEAIRLGVADFLLKPIDPASLKLAINSVEDRWRLRHDLRQANKELKSKFEECQNAIQETRESKLMLERIAEGIGEGVLLLDKDFRILWGNRTEAEQTGYAREEMVGRYCYKLTHHRDTPCEGPADHCPIYEVEKYGTPVTLPHTHFDRNGKTCFVEVTAYPIKDEQGEVIQYVHVTKDITEKRQAEKERKELKEKYYQAQRMESVGRLAGGIAHDFNNLLTVIIGYCELALLDAEGNAALSKKIMNIREAGERASTISRQLLTFSRKQVLDMQVVNLNDIISNFSKLLVKIIGDDIDLQIKTNNPVENIVADQGQIEQVLMNLAINARDAMPNGGVLAIETANIPRLDEEKVQVDIEASGRTFVRLSVADNGLGMEQKVKDNIFEPFFTTKELDKGTGLGLATVHGIVTQHDGQIQVESEKGRGTTFHLYFPATESEKKTVESSATTSHRCGTEKILVVDDDSLVRQLVVDSLTPLGYRLLEAMNGNEALKVIDNQENKIDLLLTDVVMPGMNGRELATQVCEKFPGTKVIYMSGYPDDVIVHHGVLDEGINFLMKPLTPTELLEKLKEVLPTVTTR